jgi:lipoprotein signal peptidase
VPRYDKLGHNERIETYPTVRTTKGCPAYHTRSLRSIALDQLTKYLVRANMEWGQSIPSEGFIRLTYTTNTGGAFGIFANQTFLLAIAAVLGIHGISGLFPLYSYGEHVCSKLAWDSISEER